MNSLKDLVEKIYNDIKNSDLIKEYPEFSDKNIIAYELEGIALDIMPNFIPKTEFKEFIESCEEEYKESTFKKYIANYSEFLNSVESEFYKNL